MKNYFPIGFLDSRIGLETTLIKRNDKIVIIQKSYLLC
jgi:hypothetical protein